jgi:hypothetical protein
MNQLDALSVDNTGAVAVRWVNGLGTWNAPVRLTGAGFAPPGAPLALACQASMNQLDALFVDSTGALNVLWVNGLGTWSGPARLTGAGFAPPGATVALAHQASNNQLDALSVDNTGAVAVRWVNGLGTWNAPVRLV